MWRDVFCLLSLYWPDDDGHQPHDRFIQAVKEVPEGLALLLHVADDQTEAHGEDHQSEGIHSSRGAGHRDSLLHCLLW